LALLCALASLSSTAHAEPEAMTRTEIIDLAKSGVDHGYKWGFGHWTDDGSMQTECKQMECDDCSCIKREEGMCTNWYANDTVGADCSGFVAKTWQVPSPSAITENRHPYNTKAFKENLTHWVEIERSELKQGDALVYRNAKDTGGHIVLFDSFTDADDNYWVYEAKGCLKGIVHNKKKMYAAYIAIRRNDVTDFECKPDTCNGNGECTETSGCACELGYTGTYCDRCELGFVGYPTCRREDDESAPVGRISCEMASIEVLPQQSPNEMQRYACNLEGGGGEIAYRFDPRGLGKAKIRLEGDTSGKSLALLRGACSSAGCVSSHATELAFDFSDSEVFYVVVESEPGATGTASLRVDCEQPGKKFIGDPCNEAAIATSKQAVRADAATRRTAAASAPSTARVRAQIWPA
jgi:hypothetical protein